MEQDSAATWDTYNAGRQALLDGDPEQALLLLRGTDTTLSATLASLEAQCLSALGRYADSARLLEATALRDPRDFWLPYNLATQYRLLGEHDKALDATRRTHACLGWHESRRNGYIFTHDYFSANIPDWTRWFRAHIAMAPIRCLEIGSWQGGSAAWLLDNVVAPRGGSLTCIDTFEGSSEHAKWLHTLGRSLEQIFDDNIARTGHAHLCHKLVGRSQDVLHWLHDERFDFIYVDGAHEAKFVIQDALLCWGMLRPGGFLLFDDTHYKFATRPEQNTNTAITAFRTWFADEMQVLTPETERQMLVRRVAG